MPAPLRDLMEIDQLPAIRVALLPVNGALHSLSLIGKDSHVSGLASWISETAAAMSEEELEANRLVMIGMHYAIVPDEEWSSFPVYIDHLSRTPGNALRDRMLNRYCEEPLQAGVEHLISREEAVESPENYLAFLRQRFDPEKLDEELELRVFEFINDPTALRQVIVDHLWRMWRRYLKAEWERVLPTLKETVRAYQSVDFSQMSFVEAFRMVTGREYDEEKWAGIFTDAERLVFVPHPHLGPYLGAWLNKDKTLLIFFGPRQPRGLALDVPELSRAEIVVRLSALADDTRLRILRSIAEQGEMRSQEVMDALGLSQSAASRHLTQLTATGFLHERRCEGAKCYTLNPERINDTLQALSGFLLVRERSEI